MHKIIRTLFQWLLSWLLINKGRLFYQLELANISTERSSCHQGESPDDAMMTTGAFSQTSASYFPSSSWLQLTSSFKAHYIFPHCALRISFLCCITTISKCIAMQWKCLPLQTSSLSSQTTRRHPEQIPSAMPLLRIHQRV